MIQNKIVAHYQDGRLVKGSTGNLTPNNKDVFHLMPAGAALGRKSMEVRVSELKAVFFIKDFIGNPQYNDKKEFDSTMPIFGRKIKVIFKDGELMIGTTHGYQPDRLGFFIVPADPQSNIVRCFVVISATQGVSLI